MRLILPSRRRGGTPTQAFAPTADRVFHRYSDGTVMRRISLVLGLTLLAASLGCKHVGGKHDCLSHPGDAAPQAITPPYPSAAVIVATPPAPKPGN